MIKIYCEEKNGMHIFYLVIGTEKLFLFSQVFKVGVDLYFRKGVSLNKGIRHGIGKTDRAIHRTIDKVKRHIRYIEKEYDLIILDQTRMKATA